MPLPGSTTDGLSSKGAWREFTRLFLGTVIVGTAAAYLFVLLIDPYGVVPFSLPIHRHLVSISQRYMYPQVVRSRKYDSLIVGTSTSRLLDPALLDGPFAAHFANLAMDSATAWEQQTMINYFRRNNRSPKVLIVGLDGVWCDQNADRNKITFRGFPYWLYDDNSWNDYLYLLNAATVEIAGRMLGNALGLYRKRLEDNGFGVFVPPDGQYDLTRARARIWPGGTPKALPDLPPPQLSANERAALEFPALNWLDATLSRLSPATRTILAYMPVHVAAQPWPGTRAAAVEAECKARIADIANRRGAQVIDWRIASALTRNDSNYWDKLHYRLPIAHRLARRLAQAALTGQESEDGFYRIVVR